MPADPLQRAEIHILAEQQSPSPVRITGLVHDLTIELGPGQALVLPAIHEPDGEQTMFVPPPLAAPAREEPGPDEEEVLVPEPLSNPIRGLYAPGEIGPPIRESHQHGTPIRLTQSELSQISELPIGTPITLANISPLLDLSIYSVVAQQAVDADRPLVILARTEDE